MGDLFEIRNSTFVILNGGAAGVRDLTRAEPYVLWTGTTALHAACVFPSPVLAPRTSM